MTLFNLRLELENINREILELFARRRAVASRIQDAKKKEGHGSYDPGRELELFLSLKDELRALSLGELKAFSLLMEEQAGADYPRWSDEEGINPLLLLLFHPDKIKLSALEEKHRHLAELVNKENAGQR